MKNEINYYYKILPDNLYRDKDNYYFYYNDQIYYLVLYLEEIDSFNMIITIMNEYIKRNVPINSIVLNTEGNYVSDINNKNYVLLKVVDHNNIYDLNDINKFDKVLKTNKVTEIGYISWDKLWSNKIDYYEEKIININNKDIKDSFDYYVGLSENAISYVKYTYMEDNYNTYTIGHKRFNKKIDNILNPFNLLIDYEVRDISEYIKYKYFYDSFSFKELEDIINNNRYSIFEIRLLFGRLLYPNYYFDLIDEFLNGNNIDKEIKNVISKINMYEDLLIDVFNYLSEYYPIPKIDWLSLKDK